MACYSYKDLVSVLEGSMVDCWEPIDKEKYGDEIEPDYDGNLHEMAADRIIDLEARLNQAKERIADMIKGDDGQAWKEAEKFMAIEEGKA